MSIADADAVEVTRLVGKMAIAYHASASARGPIFRLAGTIRWAFARTVLLRLKGR